MSSRRGYSSQEKTGAAAAPEEEFKVNPSDPSNIRPAVPGSVIAKLLAFTLAMITLPIGTYFLSVDAVFKGNSTYAGATAAIMANVVLVGYVIVAMQEDQSDRLEAEKKEKKGQ